MQALEPTSPIVPDGDRAVTTFRTMGVPHGDDGPTIDGDAQRRLMFVPTPHRPNVKEAVDSGTLLDRLAAASLRN